MTNNYLDKRFYPNTKSIQKGYENVALDPKNLPKSPAFIEIHPTQSGSSDDNSQGTNTSTEYQNNKKSESD